MAVIRKLQRMKCAPKITNDISIKNQTLKRSTKSHFMAVEIVTLANNFWSQPTSAGTCALNRTVTSFTVLVNFGFAITRDKVINMTDIIVLNCHSDRFIHVPLINRRQKVIN